MNFLVPAAGHATRLSAIGVDNILKGTIRTRLGTPFESILKIYQKCLVRDDIVIVCITDNVERITKVFGEVALYVVQESIDESFASIKRGAEALPSSETVVILCYDEVFERQGEVADLISDIAVAGFTDYDVHVTVQVWDESTDYGVFETDDYLHPKAFYQSGQYSKETLLDMKRNGSVFYMYRGLVACRTSRMLLDYDSMSDFFTQKIFEEKMKLTELRMGLLDVGTLQKIVDSQ